MHFNIIENADGVSSLVWGKPANIFPNVFISMNVKQGSLFTAKDFGLNLTDIKKATDKNLELVKTRIKSALGWLLETEKARAVKVNVSRNNLVINRFDVYIEIIQANNQPIVIENFIKVGV